MAAETTPAARHRPRSLTVFAAAFVAGAVAAVGVNRALDVHLAQAKPQVECEPIFVALRSLPQGVPVTVWDVALRDWPKAMLPDTAMRVTDSFEGCLLKYPLREGQPLLSVQLGEPVVQTPVAAPSDSEPTPADEPETIVEEAFIAPAPASKAATVETAAAESAREPAVRTAVEPEDEPAPPQQAAVEPKQPATGDERVDMAAVEPVATEPAPTATGMTPIDVPAADLSKQAVVTEPTLSEPTTAQPTIAGPEPTSLADDSPAPDATVATDSPDPTSAEPVMPQPVAAAPVAAEPVAAAPVPAEPVATEPQTVMTAAPEPPVAREPTLAAPLPSTTQRRQALAEPISRKLGFAEGTLQPARAAKTDIGQILGSGPSGGVDHLPSRQAPDLADLPSVMARSTDPVPPAADDNGDPVRYLVVPERIARQADTSFAAPLAPVIPPPAARPPQMNGQLPPHRQPRPAAAAGNPRSDRSAANRSQPSQQNTAAAAERQATGSPKAWGGMFPNVSAGLEAIGRWRNRGRDDVANERPAPSQPRR